MVFANWKENGGFPGTVPPAETIDRKEKTDTMYWKAIRGKEYSLRSHFRERGEGGSRAWHERGSASLQLPEGIKYFRTVCGRYPANSFRL